MGYRRPAKRYRLQFEGADYDGLEVAMSSVTTGEYLDIAEALSAGAEREGMESALKLAASKIVRWNVEDEDGVPVPTTADGLRSLDMEFVGLILSSWMAAMAAVPPPLPQTSNGSRPLGEASLPMETLPASPLS